MIPTILLALAGVALTVWRWIMRRRVARAEAAREDAEQQREEAERAAEVATIAADAARDGAAAMVAVGEAGAARADDPVDPGAAIRARVKRAEAATIAAGKVKRKIAAARKKGGGR